MVTAGVECVLSALAVRVVGGRGADTSRRSKCRGGNTSKAPASFLSFVSFNLRFNRTPNLSFPPSSLTEV